jgi:hypothetical protein
MMPLMNRDSIERAEKVAARLEARRALAGAAEEARGFKKPASLRSTPIPKKRTRVKRYEFTDAQLEIALRSLDARGAV